jgi:hypothetical protein
MYTVREAPELIRSLCWSGDSLVDWVAGGMKLWPGEPVAGSGPHFSEGFDAAKASPSGTYVVLYERLGVQGLVLKNGQPHREIQRTPYHAKTYDHPIEIFMLDGREVLAHCPDEYCEIVIEDIETGERLSPPVQQEDFFHSRLEASPSGNILLSAGWFWHPVEGVCVLDSRTLIPLNPEVGMRPNDHPWPPDEMTSAVLIEEERFLAVSGFKANSHDEQGDPREFPATSIGVFKIALGELESIAWLEEEAGTIMRVGDRHVVGFYSYPKLFEIATGKVVRRWTEIPSGTQMSSISFYSVVPPMALDSANRRFAVAEGSKVHVVTDIEPDALQEGP